MEQTIIHFLIACGYPGIFLSALIAGSILPFSSEIVLVALVKLGLNPVIGVLLATAGNTLGGMTCYYMGRLGKVDWIEKYFHVKKEKMDRMEIFLQGKGAMMAFFAFMPIVGELIAMTLGFMHSNHFITFVSMFIGKLLRYIVLMLAIEKVIDVALGYF